MGRKLWGILLAGSLGLANVLGMAGADPAFAQELTEESTEDVTGAEEGITTNEIVGWPGGPEILALSGVVMEDSSDMILYAKNMDMPLDPGSTVKVMTVLLALEKGSLEEEVTMTQTGVGGVTEGGLSISSQLGEIFTMEQCVYAVTLASANDVALQIAEHVGGSVKKFVKMMNDRAKELGCTNTLFTNPTGLTDPDQRSTAHDMALVMQAAMANEDFARIIKANSYVIPPTNKSGGERVLTNSFSMLGGSTSEIYQGCLGGKKGYTQSSGSTLICAAERNGMTLLCSVLKGTSDMAYEDAISLLNYGFENFEQLSLGEKDFDILSGGDLVVPIGLDVSSLRTEDVIEGETLVRTYFLSDVPVGTALIDPMDDSDDSAIKEGEAHLAEALAYSEKKSRLPYYLIGAAGLAVLVLYLAGMIHKLKR